jgi:hypothetical protein
MKVRVKVDNEFHVFHCRLTLLVPGPESVRAELDIARYSYHIDISNQAFYHAFIRDKKYW